MTTPSNFDPLSPSPLSTDSDSSGRISIEVMDRWLVNEPSLKDMTAMQEWVLNETENAELLAAFRALRVTDGVSTMEQCDQDRVELALRRVHIESGVGRIRRENSGLLRRIGDRQRSTPRRASYVDTQHMTRHSFWSKLAAYSTAVLTLIGVVMIGLFHGRRDVTLGASTKVFTYATEKGERAIITLPDGSRVVLNVASRLNVPAGFGVGSRTVELVGEAQFTVEHQPYLPFVVTASGSSTRVLGTTFLVRRYASDSLTAVVVRSGRVVVDSVVVSEGQGVMMASQGLLQRYHAQDGQFTFVEGVLTLEDITFREAIVQLNRWYNVEIELEDSALANRGIGGSFATGSISDLVMLLELTYDIRVNRIGRRLILSSR